MTSFLFFTMIILCGAVNAVNFSTSSTSSMETWGFNALSGNWRFERSEIFGGVMRSVQIAIEGNMKIMK